MNCRVLVSISFLIAEVVLVNQPNEIHSKVKKCKNWENPRMAIEIPHCLAAHEDNRTDALNSKLVPKNEEQSLREFFFRTKA